MTILFMGTPDFAVPSLEALIAAGHTICGVFTQPDRPKNRGMKLQAPPVKRIALAHDIPVFQPVTLKDGTALEEIRQMSPELIVVAAYGRLLPRKILELPAKGCINVHSSLLPKYRGAAPINWAVLNGEEETGVTIMYMAQELDAGDIIAQASTPIDPEETVESVHDRLAGLGARLLVQTVARLEAGTAERTPQDGERATYAPMLSRELSPIDWTRPAREIHDQIRGLIPWPASSTDLLGAGVVKVFGGRETGESTSRRPGTILSADKRGIRVACGDGKVLCLTELQAPGSRRMSAADYLRGHPVSAEED